MENKKYEIGYIISPLVPAEKLAESVQDSIVVAIESSGGEVIRNIDPKMIDLAYSIKHTVGNKRSEYKSGYFGAIQFALPQEKVVDVMEAVKKSEMVIRFMVISLSKSLSEVKPQSKPSSTLVKAEDKQDVPSEEEVEKKEIDEKEIDKTIEGLLS